MLGELEHFGQVLTRNAVFYRDEPGLAMGAEAYTWRQNEARANRLAHALQSLGLRQGDHVAVWANNSIAFVETQFALARLGMVTVPLNTRLTPVEARGILDDAQAKALFLGDEHLESGREAATGSDRCDMLLGLGGGDGDIPSYASLLERRPSEHAPELERRIAPDDLLHLLYTSGTTGFPKGVMYTHQSALWTLLIHVLAIGSHHRHRVMLPSPLFSAAGFAGITCALGVGSPTHLLQFSIDGALELLDRERITFTNLVPTTVKLLLEQPDFGRYDLSHLEVLLYGGSPMPEPTLRLADSKLRCGFRQSFATSETGLSGTVLEPHEHREALDREDRRHLLLSCGRPQVAVGVRLLDDDWNEVPTGEVGEVAVHCAGNMLGYWNRPEATAEVMKDGWLRTGDVARRDEEGFHYLIDRKGDMIVSGAFNVYPTEVERVLLEHEAVRDVAVIGVPDDTWVEAVMAYVVLKEGAETDTDAILAHASEHLANYKRPKTVELIDEIPRNPAGKPLRRVLRAPHWPEK